MRPVTLKMDEVNTDTLKIALLPTNKSEFGRKSELRSFLGLCNVYRRFTEGFTNTATRLNQLLKKNAAYQFILEKDQRKAFRRLIDAVIKPPILALPVVEKMNFVLFFLFFIYCFYFVDVADMCNHR